MVAKRRSMYKEIKGRRASPRYDGTTMTEELFFIFNESDDSSFSHSSEKLLVSVRGSRQCAGRRNEGALHGKVCHHLLARVN